MENILIIVTSMIFLIAVYFSFKLSKETNHEKYWFFLALGFFTFAIHHWTMIPGILAIMNESTREVIEKSSAIIGATFVAYATYGLYASMKKINKKLK